MRASTRSRRHLNAIRRAAADLLERRRPLLALSQWIAKVRLAWAAISTAGREFQQRAVRIGKAIWRGTKGLPSGRSLIGDILALQLFFAFFVGGLAIFGLWWTSTWAIEDNLQRWGEQWIAELDDLGIALYGAQDENKFIRIERYIRTFPEIAFVRYYSAEGEVIFEDFPHQPETRPEPFDATYLQTRISKAEVLKPFELGAPDNDSRLVRISKPIRTESLLTDGLLEFGLNSDPGVETTLVGFIELGLDFSGYRAQLSRNIASGSSLGLLVLVLLTAVSWWTFRRALRPLSQLQEPLRELATGRTDIAVESSGHREIVAITDALKSTVTALNERDKKLWQLANHDTLTGLINRHKFSELLTAEIEHVRSSSVTSALLFVDLDQFKYVNDTLGHAAGDRLLRQAAERLKSGVRRNDVVSRFGGDEFTVLLSDVSGEDVAAVCEGILQDMREHLFLENGQTFNIPCSIGVAMIGREGYSPAELLAHADMACHEAKARGRNRVEFYETAGAELDRIAADAGWSQAIQKCLKDDSFVLHYQPIADVRTGKPTHYEVLLRMRSAGGELVPPTAFLPAASRFGLMVEVDQWVIRNALAELRKFRRSRPDLRFTLNVSGNIFEDTDLYGCIEENLTGNDLPPDSVILEITEQVAVRNIVTAADQIADISKLGCKFAIDDFGAGYSSYSYLKSLPVDYIKIDGTFVKNLVNDVVDRTIVGSISQVARATGKETIAEHVMNAATFDLLRELEIDLAQGFYVGKPTARPGRRVVPTSIENARKRKKKSA